jgi:hypothetical protein
MTAIVGVFDDPACVIAAVRSVRAAGIPTDHVNLLGPESSAATLAHVPTTDAEPAGIGNAVGAVVGGATGAAVGLGLGALVTATIPGVGPIAGFGVIAALLAGGGAVGGASAGQALETALDDGVAKDELFFYRDALRRGRTVLIVTMDDADAADRIRRAFEEAGAESVDAARRAWWLGLGDAAAEEYEAS